MFAGLLLRSTDLSDQRKVGWLLGGGVAMMLLGWLWNFQFPVIKKIWTSSYVLVAGGYSGLLLGMFYWMVDVKKRQKWCLPFVWIGMNSITVYLTSNFIGGFRRLAARLAGGDVQVWLNEHWTKGAGDMLVSVVGLLLMFYFVHFLYRRKIFVRF